VVTDPSKRAKLAAIYKRSYLEVYSPARQEETRQTDPRLIDSANYLAEHLHKVPVLIIPCVEAPLVQRVGPGAYANILPAAWSLMLALRARGIGAAWTTLHLRYEKEAAALLGIPDHIAQAALLPVAYFTGDDFRPAKRIPARERTYWNGWEQTR
jgi:nitroreductase